MDGQHRRLAAAFTVAVFLVSILAVITPAQAHFTLGNLSGASPYSINNFDPHVAGPIGYVWPGSGENAYSGSPNVASDNLSPGYQSPYPNGNPPGAPDNSWYQLQGDTYSPFGAVLTSSTGDLIFGLNATCTPNLWEGNPRTNGCATQFDPNGNGVTRSELQGDQFRNRLSSTSTWTTWFILIPPEFTVPGAATHDASQVVSTLSNSYDRYYIAKLSPDDRYAPGWTLIAVSADAASDYTADFRNLYYHHQFIQFTRAGEWYYVRINGVTAPSVAGRYFFKMALYNGGNAFGVGPSLTGYLYDSSDIYTSTPFVWVPPQNWPVVLVKGEVDPAIITGTLRYAGYNATLYQQPIAEAAFVNATMTERINPYTGSPDPSLPLINGQAFVNATANGHYELEGLAAGVYDIYVSAAGYPTQLCVRSITVLRGQSLHFDCYLQPGPVIHGNVFTKHQFGDEPWPGNSTTGQYIKIELYTNPTLSNIVDPSAGSPISWSPLPCTAGGQEGFIDQFAAGLCGDPRDGSQIAFPWHEYSTVNGPIYNDPPGLFTGAINGYVRDVAESVCLLATQCAAPHATVRTSDPEGVGPPQSWFVAGGTTNPFHFEMGVKGEYGAPTWLSGEVPQVYATWVNGLTPGRYYVRAWTFRYVQTALDGSTFQEYYFDVTPNEWAGDVTLPIDLRLSSWVNKTVYFHDTPNTIKTNPIQSGAGYIWGYLTGPDGHVYSANVTGLGLLESGSPFYYYNEFVGYYGNRGCSSYDQWSYGNEAYTENYNNFVTGEFGAPSENCPFGSGPGQEVSALDKAGLNANSIATGIATIQFWGINDTWGGENYGIPSGTYQPWVGVNGYYSPSPPEQVSVTLSGNPTSISDHMFLGPGFNVSVYSIDWERPSVARDWVWSGCQQTYYTCEGSEIDVGFYPVLNGTAGGLADFVGEEPSFLPLTTGQYNTGDGLFQGPFGVDCMSGMMPAFTCSQMDGGGRDVLTGYTDYHDAYFGQSAEYAFVGGYTPGNLGFLTAPKLLTDAMFTTPILVWPLHFNEGQYNLAAYTYGYIQDQQYTAYAMNGQVADMRLNLIIGVNVTLDVLFKKESIITGTPYNMSARVRLFNDQGELVAEWMSSEGTFVDRTGHAIAANGQLPANGDAFGTNDFPLYPFTSLYPVPSSHLNGYNYLPGGVTLLHVLMAGLPQQPPANAYYGVLTGTYFGDPIATGLPVAKAIGPSAPGGYSTAYWSGQYGSCDFQLNCYPAPYGQYPFPYTGIAGAPDYTGGWTAEVDFVPWYANNTGTPQPLDPNQCQTTLNPTTCTNPGTFPQYYPPVNGLLMGESYHIIPGTTATSGVSLTEDMALGGSFLGHSMAANHLGPYSQEGVWQIAGTHNSGEASAIFEVDLNGFISGQVLGFTYANEFRTQSWDTISVTGASGATLPSMYTFDGLYQGFFAPGQYSFTINAPGYTGQTWSISVTPGETGTGQNLYLQQSQIPVPEFSGAAVIAFAALAASVYLLKRRRK